jgi:protein-S-isoprenylcysteine O-methyltransferase Ste14
MKQRHPYFIAAFLFVVATGLNLAHGGFGLKTVAGTIFIMVLLAYGLQLRRAGR